MGFIRFLFLESDYYINNDLMYKRLIISLLISVVLLSAVFAQKAKHTFSLGTTEFLLDEEPFQIISGELHPARIPVEYWRHRIQMAKAMGCNTISAYIFWNFHETEEGVFDFATGAHNLAEFIKIVQDEDMWLILRPGPYVSAEWELGGIPPYLLRIPDIKLRSMDQRYMIAAERYLTRLADEIRPYQITKGGPLLMIQIENEYGSFGNDRNYLLKIKEIWSAAGITIPTFTGDGPASGILEAGTLPGSAVGLNSGSSSADFELASKINPGVPVFSSETYAGWITHWGGEWAERDTAELLKEVKFLMDNRKSFNLYVIHGGTNFGFTAGANSNDKEGYQPDVTSYNYDAPINEQGQPTYKYMALRKLIGSYLPKKQKLPPVPATSPAIEIPYLFPTRFTSVWDYLPQPVISEIPKSFEAFGQDYGFILYETEIVDYSKGILKVDNIHDYATLFLNGEYIGKLNRMEGIDTISLPESKIPNPKLEILVEAMGRVSYGQNMLDMKGITESITLNGTVLKNWKIFNLPMDRKFIYDLRSKGKAVNKPGIFYKGNVSLAIVGDTYFDLSGYTKGIVWVNGNNIGRYWNIGPQKKLFCPASFLRLGMNEILIFDIHQVEAKPVIGVTTLE